MDVNEIWDYFQPQNSTLTEPVSLDERMEDTSLPTLPSICPNDVENILNSLSPEEDTIGNHINETTAYTGDNNDYDMDSGYNSFASAYAKQVSDPNDISPNLQNHLKSGLVYGDVQQFSPSSFTSYGSSLFSSDISHASFPMEINITSYSPMNSTHSPGGAFNEFKGVETITQLSLTNKHQSKVSDSKDRGFKQILSLCMDASIVREPWQPKVAKKILAAYYTPLNLKSEFLANQVAVDNFQSIAIEEAVSAFHALHIRKSVIFKKGKKDEMPCPEMFVKSCKKIRAYKRLLTEDKLTLLTNIFFDSIALESVLTYDQQTDTWSCSGVKVNRLDVFRLDASLHNGIIRAIETFPDRWRRDLTVTSLLYLIIIFNPDLPDLKFEESIRLEQYTYIYLLQRYLESACKSPCDAQDYLYRLMAKISDIQNLRQQMRYFFEMHIIDYSLSGCLFELIGSLVAKSKRKLNKK